VTDIPEIPIGEPIPLPAAGSWPDSVHVFEAKDAYAIRAAIAARRPLLVRGRPGVGKSQLARAAAAECGRLFVSEVVHSRSEPQDLQWRFDAIARLGEAQALGAARGEDARRALDPLRYLSPGPLWWTFDYDTAKRLHAYCRHPVGTPAPPLGWTPDRGAVLLIDEIDKADSDLPNGLLEALGNGAFTVPYLDQPVRHSCGPPPLVVVTSNEERELPPAFVRRCLVLRLELPERRPEFVDFLSRRGAWHQPGSSAEIRVAVAERLWQERQDAGSAELMLPGQAEYLDLLRVLETLAPPGPEADRLQAQRDLLKQIEDFALKKSAPEPR
jgi:MoxR-like ATPase